MTLPTTCRLDDLLILRGIANNKTQAKAFIIPGKKVKTNIEIYVREKPHPWVSRGGIKLAHALEHFQIPIRKKICMDIGASTGGVTDVLLFNGAQKVYAVDSGTGQLDWNLRNNDQVVVHERTNARHLTTEQIPEAIEVITCDASFISLTKILPTPLSFAKEAAFLIALIKPQFEANRNEVKRGGIVIDPHIHKRICKEIWYDDKHS